MNGRIKNALKYIISALLLVIIVFIILKYRRLGRTFNFRHMKRFILSYGKFSSLIFILIYTLKPIIFIVPASLLSILAGNVFGPYISLLLSMIGCFGAGTVAFYMARFLGRSFVDNLLKGKALKLDNDIEKNGFIIMLIMRLSVIFPYDPLGYAAGLTKMKYRDFISATMIGILPEMVTYSLMGKNIEHPFSLKFIMPIIIIVIIAMTSSYFYRNKISKKNK